MGKSAFLKKKKYNKKMKFEKQKARGNIFSRVDQTNGNKCGSQTCIVMKNEYRERECVPLKEVLFSQRVTLGTTQVS
jgi:ArsR family metal-binding transcriptional regulator